MLGLKTGTIVVHLRRGATSTFRCFILLMMFLQLEVVHSLWNQLLEIITSVSAAVDKPSASGKRWSAAEKTVNMWQHAHILVKQSDFIKRD